MCGIIGYVSVADTTLPKEKDAFLEEALVLDTFRGMDSTGLLTVCEDFDVDSHKTLDVGWDFIRTREFWNMPRGWAAIGHNRAATKGEINVANAHPFNHGPVQLVHNGTLQNMGKNLPNFDSKFDVDSLQIARALGSVPPEEASEAVLRHIQGAFALAWTDERDSSINITRNAQRPLHFTYNSAKSIFWFMSDGQHLNMLKKRNWCMGADMGTIYQLGTHAQLKFRKGSIVPEVTTYVPFVRESTTVRDKSYRSRNAQKASSSASKPRTEQSTRNGGREPFSRRVYRNGESTEIPKVLLQDLEMTTDLDCDDILKFQPERFVAYPEHPANTRQDEDYGYVEGTVWIPEWECVWACIVHNVPKRHSSKVSQDYWDVHPYATTEQCNEEYGMAVMAKVRRFDAAPEEYIPEVEDEEPEVSDKYLGPFGRRYSLEEWRSFTKHGCSSCSQDLDPDDHEGIWWMGEMEKDPLCSSCCTGQFGRLIH